MKPRPIHLAALALGLAGSLSLGAFKTSADVAVSVGVQVNAVAEFHAPLEPHGVWVDVGSYGRCWRPSHVAVGWRPYCDGHWEWTDCGWYWVSDEPWAWACYHYGSWVYESGGWFWAPGIEWAPAWVSWRVGGGHIGWAPLAPRGVVAPSLFVFVDGPRFRERITPKTVIVNNTTIINKTTQITEVKRETRTIAGVQQKVVVNDGPGVETVQKITGKKVAAIPVQEVDRKTSVPTGVKRRGSASATKDAAPTTQDQKKAAPDRKADQPAKTTPPTERPAKPDKPDNAAPPSKPDKPDRALPTEKLDKSDKVDRTPPAQKPNKPDRTPPTEKPAKPDRASPPDRPEKPDRAAPAPERPRPESPPQRSPGHPTPGGEKGGKRKDKGPDA